MASDHPFDGLELPAPANFHVNLRDGDMMNLVVPTIRKGGVDMLLCGVWCVMCGVWCVVCDVWCVVCVCACVCVVVFCCCDGEPGPDCSC
jgi:hypothetical protein